MEVEREYTSALVLKLALRGDTHQSHTWAHGEKASSILFCTQKEDQKYLMNGTNDYYCLQSLKIVKTDEANPVCKSACQSGKLSKWANSIVKSFRSSPLLQASSRVSDTHSLQLIPSQALGNIFFSCTLLEPQQPPFLPPCVC